MRNRTRLRNAGRRQASPAPAVPANARLLEDGTVRRLEDGTVRLLEG